MKIDIASRGWYRVTQPDLVAAGLPVPVDPSLLQLFVDGVEQPLRVNGAANGRFDPRDSVEFERGNWGAGWDVITAHPNADGQADLFLWDAESGRWRGCIRDGAASFVCSSGVWRAGGRIYPLDLDGDGRDELLRYDARTGGWTLTGVSPSGKVRQAEGEMEVGWTIAIGDSDGDGRDDLALYHPESGRLIRRLSHPSAWTSAATETWPVGWRMVGRQP